MAGLFLFLIMVHCSKSRLTCSNVMHESSADFYKVAPCSMSGMVVIARANFPSLKSCSEFAKRKRGLAFSYSKRHGKVRDTCLIYDCPEFDVLSSIRRNRNYDYYSLYADPLPTENSTCVVKVGVFRLYEQKLNYTEAVDKCREEGGELANVIGESRTVELSRLVHSLTKNGKGIRRAYVGMDDLDEEGRFQTTTGKLLSCFVYRAWSPGEPKHSRHAEDCVVLNNRGGWGVVDCSLRLPFLCELNPKGPFPIRDDKDIDKCEINLTNRRREKPPNIKLIYKKSLFMNWLG